MEVRDMSISVLAVARYFLSKSEPGTAQTITHLKLQKLVYYAQGFYMAVHKEPLFHDRIEAWTHGPACPELYQEYKGYGFSELPNARFEDSLCKDIEEMLDAVWEAYGQYSGPQLEYLTHQEEPWLTARKNTSPWKPSNEEITSDSIREYFKKEIEKGN